MTSDDWDDRDDEAVEDADSAEHAEWAKDYWSPEPEPELEPEEEPEPEQRDVPDELEEFEEVDDSDLRPEAREPGGSVLPGDAVADSDTAAGTGAGSSASEYEQQDVPSELEEFEEVDDSDLRPEAGEPGGSVVLSSESGDSESDGNDDGRDMREGNK